MSLENNSLIDSQDNDSIQNLSLQGIQLPFPTVADFINKRESSSRIFRKSPNAFFIYRKAFTNYLTLHNYKLTMIEVSRLVSNYWKNESEVVKEAFAKIAKEIDVELKEKRKHDKQCPVIWKSDKISKKQKKIAKRNFNNNNNSLTDMTKVNFELQALSITPNTTTTTTTTTTTINESDQKFFESPMNHPQLNVKNSPISNATNQTLINLPGIIQGYGPMNYDNSCESPQSEEENYDHHHQPIYNLNAPSYDQNLSHFYCSRLNVPEYNNFVNYQIHNHHINDNLFVPMTQYNWCINSVNLACQQGNAFH